MKAVFLQMVYNYTRKTNQGSWSEENLKKAIDTIKNQSQSILQASKAYNIPFATLYRRYKKGNTHKSLGRFKPVFSSHQENELISYLKHMDSIFYGLSRKEFLKLVFDYAETNNIEHLFKNGSAGDDWLHKFQKRHPEIVLRSPEPTSLARVRGFNRPQVERFYSNLEEEINKYDIGPSAIYNMDETGIFTTSNHPPKILSTKGKRQVGVVSSTERGQITTVICCCNAAGAFIPPFLIFARKRMQERLLDNSSPGCQATCSDNGWVNGPVFQTWLEFFVETVRPTKDKKVLLLLDNHEAHKYYPALEYASKNNVIFVSFAPHATNKLQPLDVSVYGPLKKFFEQELNIFQKQFAGRIVNQYDVCRILTPAYLKAATAQNAVSGFRKTGIWPYNPHLFGDEDFAPATVTDRPLETNSQNNHQNHTSCHPDSISSTSNLSFPSNVNHLPNHVYSPEPIIFIHVNKDSQQSNTPISFPDSGTHNNNSCLVQKEKTTNMPVSPVTSNPSCSSDAKSVARTSPYDIRPIPQFKAKKSKRKHQKSEVLTSTPIKTIQKEKFLVKGKPKKIKEKDNPIKRKLFSMTENKQKKKKLEKDKEYRCLVCDGEYGQPPFDDWIQCGDCKDWAHEGCTDYPGIGSYFCDLCHQ